MSLKEKHINNLRAILNSENLNKEILARKLREIVNAGWQISIILHIKDRERTCDGTCGAVSRESQLFKLTVCNHGFCNDCLWICINNRLIADPFRLDIISCPKCDEEGKITIIPSDFIQNNFPIGDYQQFYMQRSQEYMDSPIIQREFAQPTSEPLRHQLPENYTTIGDPTMTPQLGDTSSSAMAFRSCFDMLNSINTAKIKLESTQEIINRGARYEFNELKNQIQGTSYRAISEFMNLNAAHGIAYSSFRPDDETRFFKFSKKISQVPPEDKNCFIDCELITEGNIINGKPKKGDADKTEYPKIYADGDFYYVSKLEGILMLCVASISKI